MGENESEIRRLKHTTLVSEYLTEFKAIATTLEWNNSAKETIVLAVPKKKYQKKIF